MKHKYQNNMKFGLAFERCGTKPERYGVVGPD